MGDKLDGKVIEFELSVGSEVVGLETHRGWYNRWQRRRSSWTKCRKCS